MLAPEWYIEQIQFIYKVDDQIRLSILDDRLFYCPVCKRVGYHSILHQLYNMKVCPFHNVPLEYDISPSNLGVMYCADSITYEKNSSLFSNARNIPHPSLRMKDKSICSYVFRTHKMIDHFSGHIFFTVYKPG